MSTTPDRRFVFDLDLDADPDTVWRALTDPTEIVRWFATEALVVPGEGGSLEWAWEPGGRWPHRISGWEPGRRLTLAQLADRPFDLNGEPVDPSLAEPRQIAIEFTLAPRAGADGQTATRLRIVHSGFGTGQAWDDELDGISNGWSYELGGLAHYLARHRGEDRQLVNVMVALTGSAEDAWQALRAAGYRLTATDVGQPYAIELGDGLGWSGELRSLVPGRSVSGSVAELDNGLFRFETWRTAGTTNLVVSLAAWGAGRATLGRLGPKLESWLDGALAAQRHAT